MGAPTIIFGLDGATYTVLDDLMQRGVMPYLQQFISEGVKATMMSVTPPLTPPAWSTLVTGRTPGHHGITGFFQYDSPESSSLQLVSNRQMTAETIWSMVNRQGKRSGCLNFVAHQPGPKIDGWVIPGWISWRWVKQLSHPSTVVERLKKELPGFDLKALAMDFEEERKAVVGSPIDDYKGWIGLHIDRERQWFNVIKYLMEHDTVDLLGVVFDGVDKMQHLLWPYLDPGLAPAEPSADFLRIREMCWDYYRNIDDILRETSELYGKDANILICSDHGFAGSWEVVFINTWLEQKGYLTWKEDTESVTNIQELEPAFYRMNTFDHDRTTAYALTTSSNGIFINVKGKKGDFGIDPAEYDSFLAKLTEELLNDFRDPATGEPIITAAVPSSVAFAGPHEALAPDITVSLRDHGFFSVRKGDSIIAKRPQYLGTHHPEGILICRGPGIRKNHHIDPVHLLDVAPTALYAMGLDIPADLQGRVLEEAFTSDFLADRELRRGASTKAVEKSDSEALEADDEDILEKMKALGYLE
ncbi:MAG: alkaline phosphatase family protein [Bryobacteraceae bacterium]